LVIVASDPAVPNTHALTARRVQSTLWAAFHANRRPCRIACLGNSTAKEEVGGPGSMKPEHACDGKGIDYLDACFGG
jgi:hypothetical protein